MADSTVPAVKAALLSLFTASADLTGVTVTWAAPTKDEDYTEDMVWLGEDVDTDEEFRRLGAQSVQESYPLPVHFQAYLAGNDPQTTEERGWEIRNAIVGLLRADLTLGGVINEWIGAFPTQMRLRPANPSGWIAKGTVSVHVQASI